METRNYILGIVHPEAAPAFYGAVNGRKNLEQATAVTAETRDELARNVDTLLTTNDAFLADQEARLTLVLDTRGIETMGGDIQEITHLIADRTAGQLVVVDIGDDFTAGLYTYKPEAA